MAGNRWTLNKLNASGAPPAASSFSLQGVSRCLLRLRKPRSVPGPLHHPESRPTARAPSRSLLYLLYLGKVVPLGCHCHCHQLLTELNLHCAIQPPTKPIPPTVRSEHFTPPTTHTSPSRAKSPAAATPLAPFPDRLRSPRRERFLTTIAAEFATTRHTRRRHEPDVLMRAR